MGDLPGLDEFAYGPPRRTWLPAWLKASAISLSLCAFVAWVLHGCSHEHKRHVPDIAFSVAPQGDRLVFVGDGAGGHDLYLLNLATLRVERVAETPEYEADPSFSPDGRSIVYTASLPGDRADHVFLRSLESGKVRQLTSEDANDTSPCVSPDGELIVFERGLRYSWGGKGANWSPDVLCTIRTDGTDLRQISSIDQVYEPRFLADGRIVASSLDGMYVSEPDNRSSWQRFTSQHGWSAAISPDGRSLAWKGEGRFASDIAMFHVDLETGKRVELILPNDGWSAPAFSPDGQLVYFLSTEWPNGYSSDSKQNLWVVGVDDKGVRLIADYTLFDSPLTWRPPAAR